MSRIGIEIMGGDNAPQATVKGAILAKSLLPSEDTLVLFGVRDLIISELEKNAAQASDFEIVDCTQILEMHDHPVKAFKEKQDSSLVKGFMYLKQKLIDGFASAGNTGAMLVGATMVLGIKEGILRPCISSFYPTVSGKKNLLLDVGLNADVKPENLLQFAELGSEFAKSVMEVESPKVALLNIGTEDSKGNQLAKETFSLLKEAKNINFVGNIEGSDLHSHTKADVIVTDGFTGNIILKHAESIYELIKSRNIEDNFFDNFNYENYGGTPVLGVNQPVIIGHGKSNDIAIKNMILLTQKVIKAH